jgi:hypothetical protein
MITEEQKRALQQKRRDILDRIDPWFCCLQEHEKIDVIEGRAKLSSYNNVPILDYRCTLKT